MPFPTRIQPIDMIRNDAVKPPVLKSRLKRLFDRPFSGVLRISSSSEKDSSTSALAEFEPSTICLDKMVRNFIEGSSERQSSAAWHRCNCFSGNSSDNDGDLGLFPDSVPANLSFTDLSDALKSLVPCESILEIKLLAHASRIVEQHNKTVKGKDDLMKIVADGLIALSYDAAVCKSNWKKTPSIPAGDYEYIDVLIQGERLLIDVDFRSEFAVARSTRGYKAVLQCLPYIFVGKSDRLQKIVSIATEASRLSLKKKGLLFPPWRKSEYAKSKWLGPYTRIKQQPDTEEASPEMVWQLPAVKPKRSERGNRRVATGLASLFKERL